MKQTPIPTWGGIIISIIVLSIGLLVIINFKRYSDFTVNSGTWFWYERKPNKFSIYYSRLVTLVVGLGFFFIGLEMLLGTAFGFDLLGWLREQSLF